MIINFSICVSVCLVLHHSDETIIINEHYQLLSINDGIRLDKMSESELQMYELASDSLLERID